LISRNPLSGTPLSANPLSARIMAVLAALCMVGAFALAVLLPPNLSLAELVARFDHNVLVAVQNWTTQHLSPWIWRSLVVPLLVRPDWLPLVMLGMVFGGAALTFVFRGGAAASRRRRG
jgi:hypothetical protein